MYKKSLLLCLSLILIGCDDSSSQGVGDESNESQKQSSAQTSFKQSSSTSFKLSNSTTLKLPAGTKILTKMKKDKEGVSAGVYTLKTPLSDKEFKARVISNLSASGVSYTENNSLPSMTSIVINGDHFRANLSFAKNTAASSANLAVLSVVRF
jgi:hypothetical protein